MLANDAAAAAAPAALLLLCCRSAALISHLPRIAFYYHTHPSPSKPSIRGSDKSLLLVVAASDKPNYLAGGPVTRGVPSVSLCGPHIIAKGGGRR